MNDRDYPTAGVERASAGQFARDPAMKLGQVKAEIRQPEMSMLLGELAETLKLGDEIVKRADSRLQFISRGSSPEVQKERPGYNSRTQVGSVLADHIATLRRQYDALQDILDRVEL